MQKHWMKEATEKYGKTEVHNSNLNQDEEEPKKHQQSYTSHSIPVGIQIPLVVMIGVYSHESCTYIHCSLF